MSTSLLRRIGVVVTALTVAVGAADVVLRQLFPEARAAPDGVALLPMVAALTVVGGLVSRRRPHNVYGWVLSLVALAWATNGLAVDYTALALARSLAGASASAVVAVVTGAAAWGTFVTFGLLLYPTGAVPTARWRWVAWVAGAGLVLMSAGLGWSAVTSGAADVVQQFREGSEVSQGGVAKLLNEAGHVGIFFGMFAGVVSLFARVRRATAVERLQLKWFAFGGILAAVSIFVQLGPVSTPWLEVVALTAMPVVIGVAILRWHLYDIDRIISRTLAYLLLTALLVGIYLLAVTSLTALTAPVTGDSPVAVAAATLLAAAAFQPARRRIQAAVDRRFNRSRYDAQKTVEQFAARMRDQVDLEELTAELHGVSARALEPSSALLWLKSEAGR